MKFIELVIKHTHGKIAINSNSIQDITPSLTGGSVVTFTRADQDCIFVEQSTEEVLRRLRSVCVE